MFVDYCLLSVLKGKCTVTITVRHLLLINELISLLISTDHVSFSVCRD